MYRYFLLGVLSLVLFSCKPDKPVLSGGSGELSDSVSVEKEDVQLSRDEQILQFNKEFLQAVKDKNWEKIAENIHPEKGLCFSPYAYFVEDKSVCLKKGNFLKSIKEKKQFLWGITDGEGLEIKETIPQYFENYVYGKNFLKDAQVHINESVASGNSINNVEEAFPDDFYVENYVPGKDPETADFTWQALRVVMQKYKGKWYAVALINDRWTI